MKRHFQILAIALALLSAAGSAFAQSARILDVANQVVQAKAGTDSWTPAVKDGELDIGDRIRTLERSRATVALRDLYFMRMNEATTVSLTPQLVNEGKPQLDLRKGALYLFSREKNGKVPFSTPVVNGGTVGTQVYMHVAEDGTSFFQVMEGKVILENQWGNLTLEANQAGEARRGQAPRRTAVLEARNILQWALYYPAVLGPQELAMGADEERAVGDSLAAYRAGDLLGALERYPKREPAEDGGRLYKAAVLLAVGRVDQAEPLLARVAAGHSGRRALERMIAVTKFRAIDPLPLEMLESSAEAIVESYLRQSRGDIPAAREAVLRATSLDPDNGYAWVRLAEVEFSRGDTHAMRQALSRGRALVPRNAQAYALAGFAHSADNCMAAARFCFEQAIALDGALGNGWLGLGLAKIKAGDLAGGRADLQAAATVEPRSSIFHSYLGKAFGMEDRPLEARKDLDLARELDPHDPTPWLYSAIELQRNNRTNEAIADLQQSIALNDNRRIYRSRLLLDQDRAVRSANLARIYQAAGMREVAVREATRAVESDYANPSAHLFLANSFDALRDSKRISLRYETPWFNELLLSNLLSPVGGGPLSQFVTQQEYSKLFEADGLGGSLETEWRGDAGKHGHSEVSTAASLFGTHGKFSFGVDALLREDTGDRVRSESTLEEVYAQLKWQPGPDDIFYFLGKWQDHQAGDDFQSYDNLPGSAFMQFQEKQEPGLLLGGWNHRWAPGSHTLLLAGRLSAEQRQFDPFSKQLSVVRDTPDDLGNGIAFTDPVLQAFYANQGGQIPVVGGHAVYAPQLLKAISRYLGMGEMLGRVDQGTYRYEAQREFTIDSAEFQHIQQTEDHAFLLGGRWQDGEFETRTRLTALSGDLGVFPEPAWDDALAVDFERTTFYVYDYWRVFPCLMLSGGLSWDHIEYPDNFRLPPLNARQREQEEFSGKFGFTWTPSRWVALRGAYAEGMGGVSFDESVRLEPVQLAGFNQSYRTVISESIAGSVEAPLYQIGGLSVEGVLPTRTWWGLTANLIEQEVDRTRGLFTGYELPGVYPGYFADDMPERLEYRERSLLFTVNQLLGDEFAVGMGYRLTRSDLRTLLPELVPDPNTGDRDYRDTRERATLHEMSLHADWNSPSGFFARVEANWYLQDLEDDPRTLNPPRRGDSFWQFNAMTGYRFNDNLCEVSAGILNIGGSDYHLSPLTPYGDLVHRQTAVVRCRFSF